MAVTLAWELPEQSGSITSLARQTWIPLGGDGFTSPKAAYSLRSIGIAGVSTGLAAIAVTMDPRFCSLVCWMLGGIDDSSPGASAQVKLTVESDTTAVASATLQPRVSTIGSQDFQAIFQPPAVILPGGSDGSIIRAQFNDDVAATFFIDAFILLFDIRARELVPYETLLAARGAGGYSAFMT